RGRVDIRAGEHLDALEQRGKLEVGGGNVAASDDADAEVLGGHGAVFLSVGLDRSDRTVGGLLEILRIVVLDDEVFRGRGGQRLEQLGPVDGAVADVGPAVLIRVLALRSDVLDVNRGDALAVFFDPGEGIGAAAHDPGDIRFPGEIRA